MLDVTHSVLLTRASALFLGRRFFCWRMAVMVDHVAIKAIIACPQSRDVVRLYDRRYENGSQISE